MNNKILLSASLICADLLHLENDIRMLEQGGADSIHCDVMDGCFVPRIGLCPEILSAIRKVSLLPIDVHMMVAQPEPYIKVFADAGATMIVVHAEACIHLNQALFTIKNLGVKAGVALNHTTPLTALEYVWDDIDTIILMAINPGIIGHKIIPQAIRKIADCKDRLSRLSRAIMIEIDGGVTVENAPLMISSGADMLVCGMATIFNQELALDKRLIQFRKYLESRKQDFANLIKIEKSIV